jgi:hypothetical protein
MRARSHNYDFLNDNIRRDFVDIMSPPDYNYLLKARLFLSGMKYEVLIPNVQKLVEMTSPKIPGKAMDWTEYHRMQDIHDWMDELAAANDFVEVETIGQSHQGRDLKVLKINTANAEKKFWIDGGLHAREWITPATVTWMINEIVTNYEANKDIVDAYQWYFLPVHNPDGYEYSHTDERLWRKTRQQHPGSGGCVGVDPNRNWGFHWMEGGASDNPCSDLFAGPEPFSEPCTKIVSDYILQLNADGNLVAFFTIHNYSQMWLTPYGYDEIYPDNYDELEQVGQKGMDALAALYGTEYVFGPSAIVIYINSGPSDDWALGAGGVRFVYTLELRDTGFWGFLLPEDQIIPTSEETWAGIKAAAEEILTIMG